MAAHTAHAAATVALSDTSTFQKELYNTSSRDNIQLENFRNVDIYDLLRNDPVKFIKDFTEMIQERLENTKRQNLRSIFTTQIKRLSWSTHILCKLDCAPGSDELIYTCHPNFDFLLYTYMRNVTPALSVKEKFKDKIRIAWCHNLATNMTPKGELKFEQSAIQTIDSVWYDIFGQYFIDSNFYDKYQESIGNVPCMEKWNTSLPSYPLNAIQPWYYRRHPSWAIPLCLCSKMKITHVYKPRLTISELLRMQMKNDSGEWVDIKFKASFLNGLPKDGKLPAPELWGRYALISGTERLWHQKDSCEVKYVQDIVSITSNNEKVYGEVETLPLENPTPCSHIFWVSENIPATKRRNLSNYSTDKTDLYKGWNPCKSVTVKYGTQKRIDNMSADHFDRMEPIHHLPSAPKEPGYNCLSFAYFYNILEDQTALTLLGREHPYYFEVKLGNTCPFLVIPEEPIENEEMDNVEEIDENKEDQEKPEIKTSDKFYVHLRLLVMKKLIFDRDSETGLFVSCHIDTFNDDQKMNIQ